MSSLDDAAEQTEMVVANGKVGGGAPLASASSLSHRHRQATATAWKPDRLEAPPPPPEASTATQGTATAIATQATATAIAPIDASPEPTATHHFCQAADLENGVGHDSAVEVKAGPSDNQKLMRAALAG